MRRLLLILLILLIPLCFLTAVAELEFNELVVAGYIGEYLEWGVSGFTYENSNSGKGLNLDINDNENNIRYQIAPTQVPKTSPGLLIGNFYFFSSIPTYSLRISPGYLTKTGAPSVTIPYEISVHFLGDFNAEDVDLERRYGNLIAASGEYIDIVWSTGSNAGAVIVQNAGIYFRLSEEVTERGLYTSTIIFELRSDS
ncbi:MAG: hypothetical protein J6U28_06140 [Bacteroidales bacterium]|nr:hypothetical protein [Bacteroidales bacterium]